MEELIGIYGIPAHFDSFSLREYFLNEINEGYFKLFHFKNRPDSSFKSIISNNFPHVKLEDENEYSDDVDEETEICERVEKVFNYSTNRTEEISHESKQHKCSAKKNLSKTGFAIISSNSNIIDTYNEFLWDNNDEMLGRCHIVSLSDGNEDSLKSLEEFHPPRAFPRGNVGTPSSEFVRIIKSGILPESFIKKVEARCPPLHQWASPVHSMCNHHNYSLPANNKFKSSCNWCFVTSIPSHFTTQDLHKFFRSDRGKICSLQYIKRPISNYLTFLHESGIEDEEENLENNDNLIDLDSLPSLKYDLYPFDEDSDCEKVALIRVNEEYSDNFYVKYQKRPWDIESENSVCILQNVKLENTPVLQFLTEYHLSLNLEDETIVKEYQKINSLGVLSKSAEKRLNAVLEYNNAGKKRTQISTKADINHDLLDDKLSKDHILGPLKHYAEVPPPNNVRGKPKKQSVPRNQRKSYNRNAQPVVESVSATVQDATDVEEWERGEAFRDTIDEKHAAKEKLFEEEIEQVWEKGGSGLNFYTDEVYWRAQQGAFDEQTTDEWDVDMQAYYGGAPGDFDAQCRQEMEAMDRLRRGDPEESCFKHRKRTDIPFDVETESGRGRRNDIPTVVKRARFVEKKNDSNVTAPMLLELSRDEEYMECKAKSGVKRRKKRVVLNSPPLGCFELHTRGIGKKLLQAQGWAEGDGLGKGRAGRPYAVEDSGRNPTDKSGLGFNDSTQE